MPTTLDVILEGLLRWGLLAAGAVLLWKSVPWIATGLRGDRDPSRWRCPSCRFDRRASREGRCPECGRIPRSEESLHPRRLAWRPVTCGVLIALGGILSVGISLHVRDHGWTSVVPAELLLRHAELTESTRALERLGALPAWRRSGHEPPLEQMSPGQRVRLDVLLARRILAAEGGDRHQAMVSFQAQMNGRDVSDAMPESILDMFRALASDPSKSTATMAQRGLLRYAPEPFDEPLLVESVRRGANTNSRASLLSAMLARPRPDPRARRRADALGTTLLVELLEGMTVNDRDDPPGPTDEAVSQALTALGALDPTWTFEFWRAPDDVREMILRILTLPEASTSGLTADRAAEVQAKAIKVALAGADAQEIEELRPAIDRVRRYRGAAARHAVELIFFHSLPNDIRLAILADAIDGQLESAPTLRAAAVDELERFIRYAGHPPLPRRGGAAQSASVQTESAQASRPLPDAAFLLAARAILDRIDPALDPAAARRRDKLLDRSIALRDARPAE